jgi:arsenate reductase (glutaredoxin)
MASTVIYHNPKCSTSRKALELLRDNGIEPEVVQDLKTPPSRDELAYMIGAAGIDVRAAVRQRVAEHPILIERPFVVTPKGVRLARPVDTVREIL